MHDTFGAFHKLKKQQSKIGNVGFGTGEVVVNVNWILGSIVPSSSGVTPETPGVQLAHNSVL